MTRARLATFFLAIVTALGTATAKADWKSVLEGVLGGGGEKKGVAGMAAGALTNDEMVAGLKEALANGTEHAISSLGQTDGFFGNGNVKIPMPPKLAKIESVLRTLKQDRYADEFILTMNRAAESAVPEASAIVSDAIRQMTFQDAKGILSGPDDAATQYFRKVGESRLTQKMLPIVKDATSKAGVTRSYKLAMNKAGVAGQLLGLDAVDVDQYVTDKAMGGLFLMIAAEEKRIRENPVARTSEILKKVFGSR